jgi:regulatory protein
LPGSGAAVPGASGTAPRDPDALDRIRERALRLLARREHGVKELGDKLMRRAGTHPEDVREVVQELADRELVSDGRYAEAFARDAVRLKPRARRLLVGELVGRGVPAPLAGRSVDAVFAEEEVDDAALARRLAEAYLPRIAGRTDAVRWRRLAGYLQRRGYDNERIYEVCSAVLPEVDAGAD